MLVPGPLCCGEAAREKWHFSSGEKWHLLRKIKEKIFLPHPITPGTGPLQTTPHPRARRADLSRRLPGAAMERGQIEPCINSLLANPASGQELSFKSRNTSLIEFDYIFIFCLSGLSLKAVRERFPPATMNMSPGYFHRKQTENLFSIPRLQIEHVLLYCGRPHIPWCCAC